MGKFNLIKFCNDQAKIPLDATARTRHWFDHDDACVENYTKQAGSLSTKRAGRQIEHGQVIAGAKTPAAGAAGYFALRAIDFRLARGQRQRRKT